MLVHYILHWSGIDNVNGTSYAFWSGIGSDIGELVIFGYLVNWYRQHKKHMRFHRKHMEAMNVWLDQSPPETTSDGPSQDIDV